MANEGVFADNITLLVKMLDADQVEMRRAVHRRAPVRLEDQQWRGIGDEFIHLRRPVGEISLCVAQDGIVRVPHQPQTGPFDEFAAFLAAFADPVFAIAQKGEMVLRQPGEEFLDLGHRVDDVLRCVFLKGRRHF